MIKKCCDLLQYHHLTIGFIESASAGYNVVPLIRPLNLVL